MLHGPVTVLISISYQQGWANATGTSLRLRGRTVDNHDAPVNEIRRCESEILTSSRSLLA